MTPAARIYFCTSLRCKTPAFLRTASSEAIDLFAKSAAPAMEGEGEVIPEDIIERR
jgi:hypothetical protein